MSELQSISSESGSLNRSKSSSKSYSTNPFLAIIQNMVAQMEENGENQLGALDLETLDLSTLFENTSQFDEEEIDYESLMQLLALQTPQNFDFQNNQVENEEVNIGSNLVVTKQAEIINASGIDVSKLEKVTKPEKFEFNLEPKEEVANNVDFSVEFTKITTKSSDFNSQMELFSSMSNKTFDIRNVADENDTENEILNLAIAQAEANEIRELMLDRAMPTTKVPSNPEIFNQVKTAIIDNAETLEVGASEFIMKLSPEELGDVTIKLINEAGKATLEIIAASETASRLINEDLAVLRDVFRPMQIEVQNAQVVIETQESQMQGFDMQNQQFNQNQQNQQQNEFVYYGNNNKKEDIAEQEERLEDPNNLSIYV